MFTSDAERKRFTVSDGAELSYLEKGEGQVMVLLHGWSQSGLQWHNQIEEFSKNYRVLSIDLRGCGESSKVSYGYRLYRLAQDVREFVTGLNIDNAVYMCHSMGCAVMWAYWDLYGGEGIEKIIFCDDVVYPSINPTYLTEEDRLNGGGVMTPEATYELALGWMGDKDGSFSRDFLRQQFSPQCPDEIFEEALRHSLLLPREYAAKMWIDIVHQDLRDVLPRIDVPTLSVGATHSLIPQECVKWQSEQMQQGSYEIFELEEGGAHFMFLENPTKYNRVVTEFLG